MSGSKSWREYETDNGEKFSISMDESNASMTSSLNGEQVAKQRSENWPTMPKGVTPRLVHCWNQANPKQKRSFPIGNPKIFKAPGFMNGSIYLYFAGLPTQGEAAILWIVTGYTGEKISLPTYYSQFDTGLDDGSTSQ
jgi:hypothetical protein